MQWLRMRRKRLHLGAILRHRGFRLGHWNRQLDLHGNLYAFVSKFDASGNYVWAKALEGSGSTSSEGIAVDSDGDVYTTGFFYDTADFNPSHGSVALLSTAGGRDIFVSKLNAAGDYLWAKSLGGSLDDWSAAIAVDDDQNAYLTGSFSGTADFNPAVGVAANLTAFGFDDMFVSKLDANGNYVWAKSLANGVIVISSALAVDGSGNVYTTGVFYGTADFNPDSGAVNNLTAAGSYDAFVNKLDSNGNFVWAKGMGGEGSEVSRGIALDDAANVYTTGMNSVRGRF